MEKVPTVFVNGQVFKADLEYSNHDSPLWEALFEVEWETLGGRTWPNNSNRVIEVLASQPAD